MENVESDLLFVTEKEELKRLDKLLSDRYDHKSRTYFQYLIENGYVLLNGKIVKKRTLPKKGDEIEVFFVLTPEISLEPENIPLDILYEDEHIIAVNKPSNMVVHPANGHSSHTFVNALLYHCKNLPANDLRPGIVHRLDKGTTGVLLAAKTETAHRNLISIFSERRISKSYLAICISNPPNGRFSFPIGRDTHNRQMMAVKEGGKEAISEFTTLLTNGELSLVKADIFTGRTHQIRVHLKHLKAPVLGDLLYGSPSKAKAFGVSRPLLHAARVELPHPVTKKSLIIEAPLPEDFKKIAFQISSKPLKNVIC